MKSREAGCTVSRHRANVALIVALALGLGALDILFQRGETRIAKEEGATATAEGRLIAELKRQAEAQLEAKNREIDSIQGRLADIERQRQELQAGMDEKVGAREEEPPTPSPRSSMRSG